MFEAIKTGKTDTEMLAWVNEKAPKLTHEIVAWSSWLEQYGPGASGGHEWIAGVIKSAGPDRDDIRSYADALDLDDYASYGGKM